VQKVRDAAHLAAEESVVARRSSLVAEAQLRLG
jgi:hypothetical protein